MPSLNASAAELCRELLRRREPLRVASHEVGGATVIDLGIDVPGGLEAGRRLAEICLAGLGTVDIAAAPGELDPGPAVEVRTDHPLAACMAAQYAGWQIALEGFFAMGSGPMRAAAGVEELFEEFGHRESPDEAVGVLETRKLPTPEVVAHIAEKCGVEPNRLWLLVAPTASQAGGVQIVARSVETALHKLHELGFDLARVESGWGLAPIPPVAENDLAALGRTNDAILYGADVVLWVRGGDDSLSEIGPQVPSGASADHGAPFAEIFERYDRDFYKIDRLLFSPARIAFWNLDTGRAHRFGHLAPEVLRRSFGT